MLGVYLVFVGIWGCGVLFGVFLLEVFVVGRRERGYKYDEFVEVYFGVFVGV